MPNLTNWKKNLLALAVSQFIYRIASRSLIPFLPLFIQDIGNPSLESTALWSGWIFAAPFIVSFITTPIWGSFGDRYGKKLIVILSLTGFSISLITMSFSDSLLFLLIAASLQEIMGGAYPAAISLTAANTPKENSTMAFSNIQFANSLGNIIGPLIGGLLADLLGIRVALRLIGASLLISIAIVIFLVKETSVEKDNNKSLLIKNLRFFLNKKTLIYCGLALLVYTLGLTLMRPGFTLFVSSKFGMLNYSASVAGLLLSVFGAAGSISLLLLPSISRKITTQKLLFFVFIFSAIGFIALPMLNDIIAFSIVLFLVGFALGVILPLVYTTMNSETEDYNKAGVLGMGSSFQMFGNLAGLILSGYIAAHYGLDSIYMVVGILFFTIAIAHSEVLKRFKKSSPESS